MMVYGTEEEKAFIREWVNRMHLRVKGGEGESRYSANDPDLQLWVAATLYVGWVKAYEMAFGPLEEERAERVYQEFAVFGTSLQVPRSMWPKDRAAFWEYYQRIVETELRLVDEAEEVYYHIIHPKLPWGLRPVAPLLLYLSKIFSVDYLPEEVRGAYGLRPTNWYDRLNRRLYIWQYWISPGFIRYWQKNYYMERGRVMVARLKERGFTGEMRMREN
ncbi:hypothetical protein BJX61DRAFT_502103 [Aspergillus egyptiacus]|nr:hypothetical protein BJX61DRAFT_502103 [Aspergillus egyptiacus]